MTAIYKLTTQAMTTRGGCQWVLGEPTADTPMASFFADGTVQELLI